MRFGRLLLPLIVFSIFIVPQFAFAANATFLGPIFPPECNCPTSAPDFKCVLATMQNVINFGISLGVVIFVLVCVYAGFLLMTSSVNAENRQKARSALMNAVIGLMVALSAWLLIDFVMKTLYNEKWGPWNSILGSGSGDYCLLTHSSPISGSTSETGTGVTTAPGSTPTTPAATCDNPRNNSVNLGGCCGSNPNACTANLMCSSASRTCVPQDRSVQRDGSCAGNPNACVSGLRCETASGPNQNKCVTQTASGGAFVLVGINPRQIDDAAPQLKQLLSCMAADTKTAGARITSISDDALYSGSSWADCRLNGCSHKANSWHYGGPNGQNKSLAVDFGNNSNSASLRQALTAAACQCNSRVRILQEGGGPIGSSLHISFGVSEGRGCN